MSKFQLPTQKGLDLFPRVTQPPTKLRFEGVPSGSQLAAQLYRMLAPQIHGFHRQQAQKYSLSVIQNYRAHGVFPGLKMTYTNLQGQEILDVRVTKEVVEEAKKLVVPWDWFLFECHVPHTEENIDLRFQASRIGDKRPRTPGATRTWVVDPGYGAIAEDLYTPPIIRYPNYHKIDRYENSDEATQISALAVDLRQTNPGPVLIDVEAFTSKTGEHPYEWTAPDMVQVVNGIVVNIISDVTTITGSFTLYSSVYPNGPPDFLSKGEAEIAAQWPYQGGAVKFSGVAAYDPITQLYENGPYVPAPDVPAPIQEFRLDPRVVYNGPRPVVPAQGEHVHTRILDPQGSGIWIRCNFAQFYYKPGDDSAPNLPDYHEHRFVTENREIIFERSVTETTTTGPIEVDLVGSTRFTAGWGVPPWKIVQVMAPILSGSYTRFAFGDRFLETVLLEEHVPINGSALPEYVPLGQLIIEPMTHSAAFKIAP